MKKSELSGKRRIPNPLSTAIHKTEWTCAAKVAEWMNDIIKEKGMPLGQAEVETTQEGNRKRVDIILFGSPASQDVICVIETKQPYFDPFDEEELKEPTRKKATQRRAKYFATSNFQHLYWFDTKRVNSLKPLEEQIQDKYFLSQVENLDLIEEPRYKNSIISGLERFLTDLYEVHTGKKAEPKQAIDELLIYRLQDKIRRLSRYYTAIIDNRCHKDNGKGLQEFFLNNYKITTIIESKVERWFEEADVNTCILILEKCSSKKEREENLVRFVYLFKPLSYFIPPAQEMWHKQIERLNEIDKLIKTIMAHSEFYQNEELRIFPKSQKELWEEGFDKGTKKYVGSKWGKYIRAPEIFFKILEKGKGKLVPLKEIAEVRFGIKTGANEFFYLTEEEIKRRGIEREFWMQPIPRSVAILTLDVQRRDKSHDATANNCSVASPDATNPMATRTCQDPNYTPPYKTWGKSRSLRVKGFNYDSPGVTYHITIGANQKQNIFTKPSINQQVINTLKNSAQLYGYKLIAYCLMPDHLHILVQAGESPKDLRKFVRGFKSYCSVATPVATSKKLWQRGFYEHILRKEESIADISEYILNNPIRKGLVQERGQYKWCELMIDDQRCDKSHDATDNNCSSVASPDATNPVTTIWKDEDGKYFLRSQYKDIMKLKEVLIDDNVIWVPNYVIKSPRECKSIVVKPEDLKYRVLMIHKDKKDLRGTNVLKYVQEGESKGYHLRPTCASRERWHDLPEIKADVLSKRFVDVAFGFLLNPYELFVGDTFFSISLRNKEYIKAIGAVLNSSLWSFMTEIYGRTVMGEGVLLIYGPEIVPMSVLDTSRLSSSPLQKLEKAFNKLSKRPIGSIFEEIRYYPHSSVATPVATNNRPDRNQDATTNSPEAVSLDKVKPDRRELDRIVMGEILGLSDEEQLEVYRAVIDLVKSRIEKAKSFGKRHKTKEGIDIDLLVKTVMDKLGDDTLGKFYREKILTRKPLRTKSLPKVSGEVRLEQDLFGWRLSPGKEHIDCASELEAHYLKVWLEAGQESIKIPEDEDYLKEIVPELESLKQKTDEVFGDYLGSILDPRLRQRLLHRLWQEVTKGGSNV